MEPSSRRPTKRMIQKLRDCLEKETHSGGEVPCQPEDMKSSLSGLYKRGFVGTRMQHINNKKILCIYVTDLGKTFLSEYDQKSKKNNHTRTEL